MALHDKHSIRHKLEDDSYASLNLSVSMPNYRFPPAEQDPRHAYAVVHDELLLADMESAIDHLSQRARGDCLGASEASGFHH